MTPAAIGDTQGTLQARKTCITPYKRPVTLIWVYTGKKWAHNQIISENYIINVADESVIEMKNRNVIFMF